MEHKPAKILIADDNFTDAEVLQQLLRDNSYHPLHAANGIEAIESAIKEYPDLILLDGYARRKRLRSRAS